MRNKGTVVFELWEEDSGGIIGDFPIVEVVHIHLIVLGSVPTPEILPLGGDLAAVRPFLLIHHHDRAWVLRLCLPNGRLWSAYLLTLVKWVILRTFHFRRRLAHDLENDSIQGNESLSRMSRRRFRKSRSASSRSRSSSHSISNRSLSNRGTMPPRRGSFSYRGSAIRQSGQGGKSPDNTHSSELLNLL